TATCTKVLELRSGSQSLASRIRCAPWLFCGMGHRRLLSTAQFLIRNPLRAKCCSARGQHLTRSGLRIKNFAVLKNLRWPIPPNNHGAHLTLLGRDLDPDLSSRPLG